MAQKTKKEDEKSPLEAAPPTSNCIDGPMAHPPSTMGGDSQDKSPVEKKSTNFEPGVSSSMDLSELEQQKMAGKKKSKPDITPSPFIQCVCQPAAGTNKQKWLPLTLDPPPSRPPLSKGGPHRDRHRDHDRGHQRNDRSDRGERGDRDSGGVGGGGYRDGGVKDGSHSHRGERENYRDHFRGQYYRHDRDKDARTDGSRDHRKGERYSNLPPRHASQSQEYTSVDGSGGGGGGGSGGYIGGGNSGGFEGSGRVYGGRSRGSRGKNWRYSSGQG